MCKPVYAKLTDREPVTAFENAWAPFLPSVDTLTFFKGEPPTQFLRERVTRILVENPWLAGSLQHGPRGIEIVAPSSISSNHLSQHFYESLPAYDLHAGIPLEEMQRHVAPHKVKAPGVPEPGEPLFKVVLLRNGSTDSSFAMFVSLHHLLGDGHTYYRIYGMLGMNGTAVEPLNAHRAAGYNEASVSALFGAEKINGSLSCSYLTGAVLRAVLLPKLAACLFPATRTCYRIVKVNHDWVAQQKLGAAAADVPHLTTNDILVSEIFRLSGCSSGNMAVNLRGRMNDVYLDSSHAGNYVQTLHYFPDEFATPAGIRRPLCNKMRTSRPEYLSIAARLWPNESVVTNWASLYQDAALPGCKQIMHMPLLTLPAAVLSNPVNACIFRMTNDQLAVMLFGTADGIDKVCASEAWLPGHLLLERKLLRDHGAGEERLPNRKTRASTKATRRPSVTL